MEVMYRRDHQLVIRYENELIVAEAWGKNSIRVRSTIMGDVENTEYALLKRPEGIDGEIVIEKKVLKAPFGETEKYEAVLTNGDVSIKAVEERSGILLSVYRKGEPILVEPEFTSLHNRNRHFAAITGGDFRLTVQFNANDGEKLFGMGQYQQETLDLKGSVLELSQKNSQATVPFVLSSLGYGFFWHNSDHRDFFPYQKEVFLAS